MALNPSSIANLPASRWWGRLAFLAALVLVVLLAHDLARLTWTFLAPAPTTAIAPLAAIPMNAPPPPSRAVETIVAAKLFGDADAEPPPEPEVVITEDAPETALNLRLSGVFQNEDGRGRALIGEGSGDERVYAVGDVLPGGATLERVLTRKVLISRNGQTESLSLPEPESGGGQTSLDLGGTASLPQASNGNQGRVEVNAGAVAGEYRQAFSGNINTLQDLAFATPYVENGQFVGFRLRPGRRRELLGQLGLQSGDILVSINGSRLENPAQGMQALETLSSSGSVSATVMRNGNEIPFSFNLGSAQ